MPRAVTLPRICFCWFGPHPIQFCKRSVNSERILSGFFMDSKWVLIELTMISEGVAYGIRLGVQWIMNGLLTKNFLSIEPVASKHDLFLSTGVKFALGPPSTFETGCAIPPGVHHPTPLRSAVLHRRVFTTLPC